MDNIQELTPFNESHWKIAFILSLITIFYNLAEGAVSTFFGAQDETLALFGFGVDSFVEVISGIGIAHMVLRIRKQGIENRDQFEKRALYITGFSFYLLTIGLILGSIINIYMGNKPNTTIAGIIISILSIATMWFLYRKKIDIGQKMNSEPIISDAKCTRTCFHLSFVLLASSLLYEFFQVRYVDDLGAVVIAFFAFKEGREAFEKARSNSLSCSCSGSCSS